VHPLHRYSSVSGGYNNSAGGESSSVAGGESNSASGAASFAVGAKAKATHNNAAVLSFDAPNGACYSAGDNTVTVCASGGLFLNGDDIGDCCSQVALLAADVDAQDVLLATLQSGHDRQDNTIANLDLVVGTQLDTLEAEVVALQSINTAQGEQIAALESEVTALTAEKSALQWQMSTLTAMLAFMHDQPLLTLPSSEPAECGYQLNAPITSESEFSSDWVLTPSTKFGSTMSCVVWVWVWWHALHART
jgi:hypothetical protein